MARRIASNFASDTNRPDDIYFDMGISMVPGGTSDNRTLTVPLNHLSISSLDSLYVAIKEWSCQINGSVFEPQVISDIENTFQSGTIVWYTAMNIYAPASGADQVNWPKTKIWKHKCTPVNYQQFLLMPYVMANTSTTEIMDEINGGGAYWGLTAPTTLGTIFPAPKVPVYDWQNLQFILSATPPDYTPYLNQFPHVTTTLISGPQRLNNTSHGGSGSSPHSQMYKSNFYLFSPLIEINQGITRNVEMKPAALCNNQAAAIGYLPGPITNTSWLNKTGIRGILPRPTDTGYVPIFQNYMWLARCCPAINFEILGLPDITDPWMLLFESDYAATDSLTRQLSAELLSFSLGSTYVTNDGRSVGSQSYRSIHGCIPDFTQPDTGMLGFNSAEFACLGQDSSASWVVEGWGFLPSAKQTFAGHEYPLYVPTSLWRAAIDISHWDYLYNKHPTGYSSLTACKYLLQEMCNFCDAPNDTVNASTFALPPATAQTQADYDPTIAPTASPIYLRYLQTCTTQYSAAPDFPMWGMWGLTMSSGFGQTSFGGSANTNDWAPAYIQSIDALHHGIFIRPFGVPIHMNINDQTFTGIALNTTQQKTTDANWANKTYVFNHSSSANISYLIRNLHFGKNRDVLAVGSTQAILWPLGAPDSQLKNIVPWVITYDTSLIDPFNDFTSTNDISSYASPVVSNLTNGDHNSNRTVNAICPKGITAGYNRVELGIMAHGCPASSVIAQGTNYYCPVAGNAPITVAEKTQIMQPPAGTILPLTYPNVSMTETDLHNLVPVPTAGQRILGTDVGTGTASGTAMPVNTPNSIVNVFVGGANFWGPLTQYVPAVTPPTQADTASMMNALNMKSMFWSCNSYYSYTAGSHKCLEQITGTGGSILLGNLWLGTSFVPQAGPNPLTYISLAFSDSTCFFQPNLCGVQWTDFGRGTLPPFYNVSNQVANLPPMPTGMQCDFWDVGWFLNGASVPIFGTSSTSGSWSDNWLVEGNSSPYGAAYMHRGVVVPKIGFINDTYITGGTNVCGRALQWNEGPSITGTPANFVIMGDCTTAECGHHYLSSALNIIGEPTNSQTTISGVAEPWNIPSHSANYLATATDPTQEYVADDSILDTNGMCDWLFKVETSKLIPIYGANMPVKMPVNPRGYNYIEAVLNNNLTGTIYLCLDEVHEDLGAGMSIVSKSTIPLSITETGAPPAGVFDPITTFILSSFTFNCKVDVEPINLDYYPIKTDCGQYKAQTQCLEKLSFSLYLNGVKLDLNSVVQLSGCVRLSRSTRDGSNNRPAHLPGEKRIVDLA